ncbi:MAG TPA: SirB2 family protein, partial [Caballeronia sp.]|nr:SirB2 family protein [Caballeronia sp.]
MSDLYLPLRSVHMTCAAFSILGFVIRTIWMLRESPLLQKRA